MSNASETERLARLFTRVIDRQVKRRPLDATRICGALGAAAGAVVGVNVPRDAGADQVLLGVLAAGFQFALEGIREKSAH